MSSTKFQLSSVAENGCPLSAWTDSEIKDFSSGDKRLMTLRAMRFVPFHNCMMFFSYVIKLNKLFMDFFS